MKNIVNIINFVRGCEPRDADDSYLLPTLKEELLLCKKFNFPSTVLLQYDALIDEKYQNLINEFRENTEIGLWLEVVEPLCKDSDILWRGRFPWDWHNDVGFLVGYSLQEREKLIDTAFNKFREIFGFYPSSCGSWHIDAYSLNYMNEKYHIKASCNCKEQYGTDGYTIWGGIYSGAYFPSKYNMLCPANTINNQINVPVFRMLGADPIYQYDMNIGDKNCVQKVTSLEPVYDNSGSDKNWVNWYLNENFNNKGINLSYTQTGQENSMSWKRIKDGLPMQFEILKDKLDKGEIEIMTLEDSGKWFSENFSMTPPQAQIFDSDIHNRYKTMWYNCKNYRLNVLYDKGKIRIRDFYLFNELFKEKFVTEKETSHNCSYYNLPVTDGFRYSDENEVAGIYFISEGTEINFTSPWCSFTENDSATVKLGDEFTVKADENEICIRLNKENWHLEAKNAPYINLPYKSATAKQLKLTFKVTDEAFDYEVNLRKGYFRMQENGFEIYPEDNEIIISLQ